MNTIRVCMYMQAICLKPLSNLLLICQQSLAAYNGSDKNCQQLVQIIRVELARQAAVIALKGRQHVLVPAV